MQKIQSIEIIRTRNVWHKWCIQPLILLLLIFFVLLGKSSNDYLLYSLSLLAFAMISVMYIYLNFIQPPNLITCIITNNHLTIAELDNPFAKNISCDIRQLDKLWMEYRKIGGKVITQELQCHYNDRTYTLIQMKSFWLGDVDNESIQELIFYLDQCSNTMVIDESLNEIG